MKTYPVIALILVLFVGCDKQVAWSPEVVAQVGDRSLTQGEVTTWEVSLGKDKVSQEERTSFIRHWVEEELLYQAALEKELDKDPWVVGRIDNITRSLLTARLVELETAEIPQPSQKEIIDYFQENSTEFVWPNTNILLDYWRSEDFSAMNQLRSNLVRGRQTGIWTGEMGSLESGRISLDGAESTIPEVWRTVNNMKVGQVSPVLKIQDAHWIFKVIERRDSGDAQSIDDVHDEIVSRLMEFERQERREEITRTLVEDFRRNGKLQWSSPAPIATVLDTSSGN